MRKSFCLATILLLSFAASSTVSGQAAPGSPIAAESPPAADLQRAADFFSARDWGAAHTAYAALAVRYPLHALTRFRLGVTLTELGRADDGEPMLRDGERLGIVATQAAFRLAEALAEQKRLDAAIVELERAQRSGLVITSGALAANPHFATLRSHARWTALLTSFDAVSQPCRVDTRFRELDFWVGDWDVRPTTGAPGGPPSHNSITLEENGCVVQEHWDGQGGSTGQSFNIYDRSIGKWRQTWVDNQGAQHDYVGELKAGSMLFEGTTPAPNGARGRIPTHLTLSRVSTDTVRQLSRTSVDGGKTWQVAYDLTYVRRRP